MYKFILNCILISLLFSLNFSVFAQEDVEAPAVEIKGLKWGKITVNEVNYEKDVVIDKGVVRLRKKGPSKPFKRNGTGHTPLTHHEDIPWDCDILIIGKGMTSSLPITDEFKKEAKKRKVKLHIFETPEAVKYFKKNYGPRVNAIFHLTC
ncbi:hypothetical protein JYT72_00350 [Crocinitomix catalasitica]|nr:hypothetical protein [Crocinitomix catalasitica]